jgi:hypothetical protein
MCNRLRYDTPGGAGSSEGRCDKFPHPPLPTHPPRSQLSQIKNTTEQQATTQQQATMPSERMNAIRDVQADILSTLKDTSYFTNDTTRAHINSLHVDNFNRLKNNVRQKRVKCERAIRACIDGQLLAPKQTQYKYHYRLFADYHEILQVELDRILEIAEYMNDQEDIIKFRTALPRTWLQFDSQPSANTFRSMLPEPERLQHGQSSKISDITRVFTNHQRIH